MQTIKIINTATWQGGSEKSLTLKKNTGYNNDLVYLVTGVSPFRYRSVTYMLSFALWLLI